jgi:arylsulfatase A-like enzyme
VWRGLLCVVSCLACACDGSDRSARNVVLVVADTLRADHVGSYGYARNVTPELDRFATGATRYANAVSSSPWTLPSHASLFTGLDPWQHGAHLLPVEGSFGRNARALDQAHLTLAEALRAEGFQTAAFVANGGFLASWLQLDQGFEVYAVKRQSAQMKNPAIFAWLGAHGREPFFLFVNYMDTHRPYNTSRNLPGIDPPPSRDRNLLVRLIEEVLPGQHPAPPELVQQVVDQYDAAVANVDASIGSLLDQLRALDLFDDTLVIVTSDHGEYFGEHRLVEHSKDVYQEALRVPLFVKRAGQIRGGVDTTRIASTHVPHLIVSALRPEIAERLMADFPRAAGEAWVVAESHFGHAKDARHPRWGRRFRRTRRALFDDSHKFIHSSDGSHELYDLSRDEQESRNLVEHEPERVARYLRFFEERPAKQAPARVAEPDGEVLEELRALGYVD